MGHLYSLILATSIDTFFTDVDGFLGRFTWPSTFFALFVVTTRLPARSESWGPFSRFAEPTVARSLRDVAPNWKNWKSCYTLKLTLRPGELGIK